MRHFPQAIASVCLIACAFVSAAAVEKRPSMMTQAQAADALGQFISAATDQSTRELDSMRQFLRRIGRENDIGRLKLPPAGQIAYRELVDRALAEMAAADPLNLDTWFDGLDNLQLFEETVALERFNASRYLWLSQVRRQADATEAHLKSIGQWPAFLK